MFIKKKNISVILWSSLVVGLIFVSSLLVYNIYLQWKADTLSATYRTQVQSVMAELYRDKVVLENSKIIATDPGRAGKPMAVLESVLVNRSSKTIDSALLELTVRDMEGEVRYKSWIYLLSSAPIAGHGRIKVNEMADVLKANESFLFRHRLLNFPEEVLEQIQRQRNFARGRSDKRVLVELSIRELGII